MKNFLCLLLLICFSASYAQNNDKAENKGLHFKFNARIQTFYPIHFGDNALAKAHKARPGFSVQMNLLEYQNFKAGFGIDFATYDITDRAMIVNLSTSKYTSSYFLLSYDYKATEKIHISPNIGYGSASLELGSRNYRYGKQHGKEFRIGGMLDYKVGRGTYLFGGVHYVTNTFDVQTAPEYQDFFSKANQIQLNLGIRFGN